MAYPPVYPYPYTFYLPPPYNVTQLHKSFPEHPHPLEHARHSIAHGLHNYFTPFTQQSIHGPKADVRETVKNYYIEVELPGVENKDALKLKWTNERTLLLEATKKTVEIPEATAGAEPKAAPAAGEVTESAKKEETGTLAVHQLVKERDLGTLMRAFHFPVAVNQDALTAKLQHGVLEIVVPKTEEAQVEHKEVHVEHHAAADILESLGRGGGFVP